MGESKIHSLLVTAVVAVGTVIVLAVVMALWKPPVWENVPLSMMIGGVLAKWVIGRMEIHIREGR